MLRQPAVLWLGFVGTVLCTLAFPVLSEHYGLTLLDGIADPDESRVLIAGMSAGQRSAHAWITATLDVLYPLVYGVLFAGSALSFFGRWGRLLAVPILVLVVVDLLEGVVQVLGLVGTVDWLAAKAVLTPAKMALVYYGLALTLIGWSRWLVRRLAKPR